MWIHPVFPPSFLAVLVLVDVSDHWTRNSLSKEVLKCLSQFPHIPSVLVLNKVNPACSSCLIQAPPGISSDGFLGLWCVKGHRFLPLLQNVEGCGYLLHTQASLKLCCCLGFKFTQEEEPGWPGRISAELTGSQCLGKLCWHCCHTLVWPLVTKVSCPAAAASLGGFLWLLQIQGAAAHLI